METQAFLTLAGVTAMLGIIFPFIAALVKRLGLERKVQDAVILGLLIAFAGGAFFVLGDISVSACKDSDLPSCATVIAGYISLVVGQAYIWYKMFWQAFGLDDRISGNKKAATS